MILGPSGSGKSTLLKIIDKSLSDYKGEVFINKREFSKISPKDWRKSIAVVEQDIFLFDIDLKNNITLGRNIPQSEIEKALSILQLDKFVENLDYGTGENGELISGGEKQRISLARASLTEAGVYLLDEPTSSLDPTTAAKVEDIILDSSKTVIMIAHNQNSNLMNRFDIVINISNGELT